MIQVTDNGSLDQGMRSQILKICIYLKYSHQDTDVKIDKKRGIEHTKDTLRFLVLFAL